MSHQPVAVITGANRGIGLEVPRRLAAGGFLTDDGPTGTFTRDGQPLPR